MLQSAVLAVCEISCGGVAVYKTCGTWESKYVRFAVWESVMHPSTVNRLVILHFLSAIFNLHFWQFL